MSNEIRTRPLTPAEQKYTYAQSMQLEGQTGTIGHEHMVKADHPKALLHPKLFFTTPDATKKSFLSDGLFL